MTEKQTLSYKIKKRSYHSFDEFEKNGTYSDMVRFTDVKQHIQEFIKALKEIKPRPTKEDYLDVVDELSQKHFGKDILEGEK